MRLSGEQSANALSYSKMTIPIMPPRADLADRLPTGQIQSRGMFGLAFEIFFKMCISCQHLKDEEISHKIHFVWLLLKNGKSQQERVKGAPFRVAHSRSSPLHPSPCSAHFPHICCLLGSQRTNRSSPGRGVEKHSRKQEQHTSMEFICSRFT